ncbi:MAG: efflux RND transporter periplasmic adaptor subunit [Desulfobacteraceae bacterium]|jgi:RND family efflux transporter MFP subunit
MKGFKKEFMYIALILLTGCGLTLALITGEEDNPFPENYDHTVTVKTVSVAKTDYQLSIPAWGFVEPCETVSIRSEISGKVDFVADDVYRGGLVQKGELLFSLDKSDYLNELYEAEAAGEQAQQAFELEKGWQNIVKKELELLDDPELNAYRKNPLLLRQPQLKELKARIKITEARQARARLNVERARVASPCTGVILEESIAKGQVLDTGDAPVLIACTEGYHIMAFYSSGYSLDTDAKTIPINIGSGHYKGRIKSEFPKIDPDTRQKQALIEFTGDNITIGAYAGLILPGACLKNVAVLEKEALHASDTLWVLSPENTLEIRKVRITGEDKWHICIDEGLNNGEKVIVSHIANPLQGMKVKIAAQDKELSTDKGSLMEQQ